MRRAARVAALCSLVAAVAYAADPTYEAELAKWRAAREKRLAADDGWLTVAGLFWLEPGTQRFGTSKDVEVVFPEGSALPVAGSLALAGGKVTLRPEAGAAMTIAGAAVSGPRELRPDTSGAPDVVTMGRLSFYVIERGGKYGLRLRDRERPQRKAFTGLNWYPTRDDLRVTAKLVPHPARKTVAVPNVLGGTFDMVSPGKVSFKIGADEVSLDALYEEADAKELFFVFSDGTSGKGSYPGGRFLYTPLPDKDGNVTLDFNRAYSPPCAFTDFATCPLPPPQNRVKAAIAAGERYEGHR